MQVGCSTVAGVASDSDDLARRDLVADLDSGSAKLMAVTGVRVAGVEDVDVPAAAESLAVAVPVATPAFRDDVAADPDDLASRCGSDRCSFRSTEVNALMVGVAVVVES